jgi:hypothetical protein
MEAVMRWIGLPAISGVLGAGVAYVGSSFGSTLS